MDASVRVKIMLAEGSGKLDLSECNLTTIPPAVFELTGAVVSRVCRCVCMRARMHAASCLLRAIVHAPSILTQYPLCVSAYSLLNV